MWCMLKNILHVVWNFILMCSCLKCYDVLSVVMSYWSSSTLKAWMFTMFFYLKPHGLSFSFFSLWSNFSCCGILFYSSLVIPWTYLQSLKKGFIFPVNMAMMRHSRLLACLKYQSLVFPCQLLHALGVLFVLLPIYHLSEIITNYNTVDSNKST